MVEESEKQEKTKINLSFDPDVLKEFQKYCIDEDVIPSHKLEELMIKELKRVGKWTKK